MCGILDSDELNRHLACFGGNGHGQTAVPPAFEAQTMLVSAGRGTTCAIRANFKLRCWGRSEWVPPALTH